MAGSILENESTETLLEYIQWRDEPDYAENAKDAFRVFTYRFQLELQKKVIPICENWGYDRQVANDIAQNTFVKIWKYKKYDHSKSKQKDFDKGVLFYLFRIARNLLADYKKVEDGEISPFTGAEEIIREYPNIDVMNISIERKAILSEIYEHIKKALDRLSPKHKIIYLTYKQYEEETKDGYKLHRDLLKRLRTELNLTQNTVRAYKNEAFDQVKTYLKIYGSK